MLFLDDAVVRHISRDRNWDEKSNTDKNESPPNAYVTVFFL